MISFSCIFRFFLAATLLGVTPSDGWPAEESTIVNPSDSENTSQDEIDPRRKEIARNRLISKLAYSGVYLGSAFLAYSSNSTTAKEIFKYTGSIGAGAQVGALLGVIVFPAAYKAIYPHSSWGRSWGPGMAGLMGGLIVGAIAGGLSTQQLTSTDTGYYSTQIVCASALWLF